LTAKIAALTRYPAKGAPGEDLREATLHTGLGMEGNYHQGGERQLCLLTSALRQWMDSPHAQKGLCAARLKENILLDAAQRLPGAVLQIGEAVLRVSESPKRCHAQCELASRRPECRLAGRAVFATVQRGGVVCVGDRVVVSSPGGP